MSEPIGTDERLARIEELEAKLEAVIAARDMMGRMWVGAEAKLAKAVGGLNSIAANTCCNKCQEAALVARATLAELKGEDV